MNGKRLWTFLMVSGLALTLWPANGIAQQNSGASYYRNALGIRFDLDLKSALKLEVANTHDTDRFIDQYNGILVQYAIRF